MDNGIEFFLRMKDMMSSGLVKAAKTAKETMTAAKSYVINLVKANKDAAQSFDNIATKAKEAGRQTGSQVFSSARSSAINLAKANKQAADSYDNIAAKASKAARQAATGQTGGSAGDSARGGNRIGGLIMRGVAMLGLAGLGNQSFSQAATRENQQVAFSVLTGSQAAGSSLYGNIVKMADVTPYESGDLARAAKTQMGYGVSQTKIMRNLQMQGDIAAAQDNPAESLQSIALAYGQVAAKGHLAGQEVLQMINAGFNPLKEISDMTGKSMAQLDKIMEKGGITIGMVDKAFEHATGVGGKFHNMMQAQSQTLSGQWSTMMDGVHHALADVGTAMAPYAKGLMDAASHTLRWLSISETAPQKLQNEANDINTLVGTITKLNEGNNQRRILLGELTTKYPDLFKGLDIEKEKNSDLLKLLNNINGAYRDKIKLADASLQADITKNDNNDLQSLAAHVQAQMQYYKLHPDEQNTLLGQFKYMTPWEANQVAWTKRSYSGWSGVTRYDNGNLAGLQQYYNEQIAPKLAPTAQKAQQAETYNQQLQIKQLVDQAYTASYTKGYFGKDAARAKAFGGEMNNIRRMMTANNGAIQGSFLSYNYDNLRSILNPASATNTASNDNLDTGTAKGISSGGPRVININGVKFMDKMADHVTINNQGDIKNIEERFEEMLLRILNSGASVQQ